MPHNCPNGERPLPPVLAPQSETSRTVAGLIVQLKEARAMMSDVIATKDAEITRLREADRVRRERQHHKRRHRNSLTGWGLALVGAASLIVYAGMHWLSRPVVYQSDITIVLHAVVTGVLCGMLYRDNQEEG